MLPVESAQSRRGRPFGVAAALFLLLAPTFLPSGGATHDRVEGGDEIAFIDFARKFNVFRESEKVDMSLSLAAQNMNTIQRVRVFCESGCPPTQTFTYEAPKQQRLRFPDEFCEVVNGIRDCENRPTPRSRLEPRWNGTWAVTLNDAAGLEVFRQRFEVQMTDSWSAHYLLHPTNVTEAVAGGFIPGTQVRMSFGRHDVVGRDVLVRNLSLRASAFGQVSGTWHIPRTEARNLDCPASGHCREYFVQVTADAATGNTKTYERVYYTLEPAEIVNTVVFGPAILEEFERTETVEMLFQTTYPDDFFAAAADFEDDAPKVQVVRVDPQENVPAVIVEKRPEYKGAGLWLFNWTIPRDLELKSRAGRAYEWQLVIPAGHDRYGNVLPTNSSNVFSIKPALLDARFVEPVEDLERAEPGAWFVETRYHDGSILDNRVNGTWFAGSLVRITDQGEVPVPDSTVRARHVGAGVWRFDYKFHPGYAFPGQHAFKFHGGAAANDTWDNEIATNNSAFLLTPALQRIALTEKAGLELRNETTGWIRGDALSFVARITYGDGSAYNSTTHGWHELNATLVKRRGESEVVEATVLKFRATNEQMGTWTANLPLTLTDSETPLGNWTLHFPLADQESPPNGGEVVLSRLVRPARINVEPQYLDRSQVRLGEAITWKFTLAYPDGRPATDQDVPVLLVDAYRWSGERRLGLETPNLAAQWRPDKTWIVEWKPPSGVRLGEFVFVPRGADKFGNPLEDETSDSFRVYVPTIVREVLTQPPPVAVRNETVFVVFDGLPGDLGEAETGCPRVSVERWSKDRWVVEVENLIGDRCDGAKDHFAAWTTAGSTTLGTYRFAFAGRDAKRAYINATSAAFEIKPLAATRPVIEHPAASVPKGGVVQFVVQRESTDTFQSAWVVHGGERLVRANVLRSDLTKWIVSWTPEYRLESGNYSFEITGRDKYGNELVVASRPFSLRDVAVDCEILQDAAPTVVRLGKTGFTFRCYLPDRSLLGPVNGAPAVVLLRDDKEVAQVVVRAALPNWEVSHAFGVDMPLGAYRFRIEGSDLAGNPIRPIETANFTLLAGTIDRAFETAPKSGPRLSRFTASALANRTDQPTISCFASYVGSAANPQDAAKAPAISTIEIKWSPNPGKGVYDLVWDAPIDASLGWYRFDCEGVDGESNALRWRSVPFQIGVARLNPALVPGSAAPKDAFKAGASLSWKVRIIYDDKTPFDPERARGGVPSAAFTLGGQAVQQRPEVAWDAKAQNWVVTWTAPDVLPPGEYALIVSGTDVYGNVVISLRVTDYDVSPELGERLFGIPGFDRVVPGVGPALGALAAVAVAIVLLRRRQ